MAQLPFAGVGAILITIALAYGTAIGGGLGLLGAICLLGSVYSRRDGLILFGPFALWDLVRTARRKRLFVFRTLLAATVLGYLLLNFTQLYDRNGKVFVAHHEMSQRAEEIFVFIGITICGFSLLFSMFTFPAILSEERETKRLDHLLVTDLRNSEILLGKMAGRVAVLLGYTMTVIPILALLSFLGGVDLNTLIIGSIILFLQLLGLIGISTACSAMSRSTTTAVRNTIGISILICVLVGIFNSLYFYYSGSIWKSASLDHVVAFFSLMSPFNALNILSNITNIEIGDPDLMEFLRKLAAIQWMLFALGWWLATRYLRQPARRHRAEPNVVEPQQLATESASKSPENHERVPPRQSHRPPVTDEPVYWNEIYASRGMGKWIGRLLRDQYWLIPVFTLLFLLLLAMMNSEFGSVLQGLLVMSGHVAFWMITFPTGVRAARMIAVERQLDTMEALLLTPLEIEEIVYQKWKAAIMRSRAIFLVFLTAWSTGLFMQKMHPMAYFLIIFTTLANTALTASIGLYLSVHSKTPASASAKYVGYSFLWSMGILFCMGCCAGISRSNDSSPVLIASMSLVPIVPQTMATVLTEALRATGSGAGLVLFTVLLGGFVSTFFAFVIRSLAVVAFQQQARPSLSRTEQDPEATKEKHETKEA